MRVLFGRIMEQKWDFGALSRYSHTGLLLQWPHLR